MNGKTTTPFGGSGGGKTGWILTAYRCQDRRQRIGYKVSWGFRVVYLAWYFIGFGCFYLVPSRLFLSLLDLRFRAPFSAHFSSRV